MTIDWEKVNLLRLEPDAAFEEANRRVAFCRESRSDVLHLDVKIDRLPAGIDGLTWLRELNLYGSLVSDLDALSPLVNLERFSAGSLGSPSPRLDFLRNCPALRELRLIATTTLDLAPLAGCLRLGRLSISCSRPPVLGGSRPVGLVNLEKLSNLKSLTHLSLDNMRSDCFETVREWSALTFVQLIDTSLNNLAGFDRLQNLDHLNIRAAPVSDLSPLAGLPRLRKLGAATTAISDVAPLSTISSLEEIDISCTAVADFRPLAKLGLKSFDLSGCPVHDIGSLSSCVALQNVSLNDTHVTSVEPILRLSELRRLGLARTKVRSLGPEGALSRLEFLDATDSNLEDLAGLAPGHSLQAIHIAGTRVADLGPLRDARDCRTLNLRGSIVADLSPILETGSREEDHRYTQQELDFRDTPAARSSDRLAELAALAEVDKHKCFTDTKDYLRGRTVGPRAMISKMVRKVLN